MNTLLTWGIELARLAALRVPCAIRAMGTAISQLRDMNTFNYSRRLFDETRFKAALGGSYDKPHDPSYLFFFFLFFPSMYGCTLPIFFIFPFFFFFFFFVFFDFWLLIWVFFFFFFCIHV